MGSNLLGHGIDGNLSLRAADSAIRGVDSESEDIVNTNRSSPGNKICVQSLLANNERDPFTIHLTSPSTIFEFSRISISSTPPTPTYPETGWRSYSTPAPFNLVDAFLRHEDLTFHLVTCYLRPADLISLYSISKTFYAHVNSRYVSYIVTSARRCALLPASTKDFYAATTTKIPNIIEIFPFTAYNALCTPDPASTPDRSDPSKIRIVPSLKYLQFLEYRAMALRDIILILGAEGHRFPLPDGAVALAKMWFLMDVPRNAIRIAIIQNPVYWTSCDLEMATMVALKLDMMFTDPLTQHGRAMSYGGASGLRAMMLAQRSLTVLCRVLKREILTTRTELLRMFARWRFRPSEGSKGLSVFGIPPDEIGTLEMEYWGERKAHFADNNLRSQGNGASNGGNDDHQKFEQSHRLLRPDELVMREGIRRKLDLSSKYMTMLLHGYMDPSTFEDAPMPFPDMVDEVMGRSISGEEENSVDRKSSPRDVGDGMQLD